MRVWPVTLLVVSALAGCADEGPRTVDSWRTAYIEGEGGPTGNGLLRVKWTADVIDAATPGLALRIEAGHTGPRDNKPAPADVTWAVFPLQQGEAGQQRGKGVPASAGIPLTGTGNITVVIGVEAPSLRPAFDTVTVWVPPPPPPGFPVVLTGSVMVPCTFCFGLTDSCITFTAGVQGVQCSWWPIGNETWGQQFYTRGPQDVELEFLDACQSGASRVGSFGAAGHDSGTVPDGAGCIVAWDFLGAGDLEVRIEWAASLEPPRITNGTAQQSF